MVNEFSHQLLMFLINYQLLLITLVPEALAEWRELTIPADLSIGMEK